MRASLSRKELMLLGLLTLLWGVNWPIMKAGVQDFAPLTFRTLCMGGGIVLLAAMARAQGLSLRVERRHWRELALLGLANMVVWYVLSIWAVKLLSSGRAAILGYTMPVWSALIGLLFYRDRLDARTGLGVLAACAAIGLLLAGELGTLAGRPAGTLLMLGAAIAWAFVLSFWMMVMAFACCSAIAWTAERDQWVRAPNAIEWGAILFNVFGVFGGAQLLWFRLATILPPVASGLSVMLIPVVGLFSGMVLLGERPTWHDWAALGCVLVAIGSVLLPSRGAVREK